MTLTRKRRKPRSLRMPQCAKQRCTKREEVAGLCLTHAMKDADEAFQRGVRERDGRCTGAGILVGECKPGLQAAHIVGRRNYSVRYDPANCHALCPGHHMLVDQHGREAEKYAWATAVLGVEAYEHLMLKSRRMGDRRAAIAAQLALAPSTDLDTPSDRKE